VLIFAAARAGLAFTPLNYRLSTEGIQTLIERLPEPLVIVDSRYQGMLGDSSKRVTVSDDFLTAARSAEPAAEFPDPESVAIVLFTSGTTSQPKAVELSHNNLTSYVTGTVEFESAGADDAALICVPPYHIAGISAALSNLYAGRKMVYLPNFDAQEWVRLISAEQVTTATVVPTMLDRIVTVLETGGHELPSLRNLAYGGSKVGLPLVRRALELLPGVGFVNAYGLTETSSSIAVLGPEEHRAAVATDDPAVRARLGSVGKPLPEVEIEVRDAAGKPCGPGHTGQIYVRGPQVAGEYRETGAVTDPGGWFSTRDEGYLDDAGYLFVRGRSDDTIIRGGENIAPAEIEAVIEQMSGVAEVAVAGLPSEEWGQQIGAFIVLKQDAELSADEVREFTKARLRSSKTPDMVVFVGELPHTATGKLLRRQLAALIPESPAPAGSAG
jgi:acyl-CoA synthetase (AMP-forming)/AMP-acid ligase II